ncbi:hypothetical protein LTR86_001638 [Recurvomyces mirabilis]|nr:hypothetical protein LTR86_001638 [Recurvomyces mirabilis]
MPKTVPCEDCIARATSKDVAEASAHVESKRQPQRPDFSKATDSHRTKDRTKDAAQVEALTRQTMDAINRRDFTDAGFSAVAPDVTIPILDIHASLSTRAEMIENLRALAGENPDYHLQVTNIDVNFDDNTKMAHVYVSMDVTGRHTGVLISTMAVIGFTKRSGKWICVSACSLRHMGSV